MTHPSRLSRILAKKRFLVLVSLPRNDLSLTQAAAECAADAIKVHLNVHHAASGTRFGTWDVERNKILSILRAATIPVGLMPGAEETASVQEMREAISAGIDFIDIYDFHMPCWMLDLPIGRMPAFGQDYSLDRLKALERLGADFLEASILPSCEYGRPLTLLDLERYHGIANATTLPVFIPSQRRIEPGDLAMLKKTGVRGVILGAVVLGETVESFRSRLPAFVAAANEI